LKILYVTYSLSGGVGNVCMNIASQISALGHTVDVIFAEGLYRSNLSIKEGMRLIKVKKPFTINYLRVFLDLNRTQKYDTIHVHSGSAIFLCMLRKLVTNQQLIYLHHGDPPWSIIAAEKKKLAIHLTRRNYLSHLYFFIEGKLPWSCLSM
jgi:hypothetical protein